MTYAMGGVPVGESSTDNLANLGTNHWSLDIGGGYSYLDSTKGHEFSIVLGFTENWETATTSRAITSSIRRIVRKVGMHG